MTKPGIGLTTANIYGARLGDDAALTAARVQAAEIENPALSTMLGDTRPERCVRQISSGSQPDPGPANVPSRRS
jgi:hypothetical protein